MDLLKEEEKLIERKQKALENLNRKQKHLAGAATSFKKARRELKTANIKLRSIRQQIKAEGIERPAVDPDPIPETIAEAEQIEENND